MIKEKKPHQFQIHIFVSLLITGIIQVVLLGIFTILFSSKLIEDAYKGQSDKKIKLLADSMNSIINSNKESALQLSRDSTIINALFYKAPETREDLSALYQVLYKSIQGRIDDASLHLVSEYKNRKYSTHILPPVYDPQSSDQGIKTYLKLNTKKNTFAVIDSLFSPKGDKVALSLFRIIKSKTGVKGFIITDLNSNSIIKRLEEINTSFFSDIYIIDNINYKFVNLSDKGDYGNYSEIHRLIPNKKDGIIKASGILIAYKTLYPENLIIAGTVQYETANTNILSLIKIILIISVIGLFISGFVAFALAKNISNPVIILSNAMKKIEEGDLSIQVENYNKDEFEILFHGFNRMSSQIRTLLDARVEREKALHSAERQALQSQINPHFLYNTLNTVKAISKLRKVPEITTIITELGKLLRNSIDSGDEFTSIKSSMELIEGYLKIQKFRYGKKFNWDIHINPKLNNIIIPRLIIQPIVENSVIHGLEKLTGEKYLEISSQRNPPVIIVKDNGPGMTKETWEHSIKGEGGVGIRNVNQRLKLYYGDQAGLTYTRYNNLSSVKIHLSQKGDIIDNA